MIPSAEPFSNPDNPSLHNMNLRYSSPTESASLVVLKPVVVALGSNIGPREERLHQALVLLDQIPKTRLLKTSCCYKSLPWGDVHQEDFLNAAVLLETELEPEELLAQTKEIELRLGKEYRRHWGPREIDLDLIDFAGESVQTAELQLPHPGVKDRPFVLLPLADLNLQEHRLRNAEWSEEAEKCRHETTVFSKQGLWSKTFAPQQLEIDFEGESDVCALAQALASVAAAGLVIALDGDLGSGKTTFTRYFAQALGVRDAVSSPSYTLCQEYRGPVPIVHWDFYRLEDCDDLDSTGFELRPDSIMLIEWASLFADSLPKNTVWLRLQRFPESDTKRRVSISIRPGYDLQLRAALHSLLKPTASHTPNGK